MKPNLDKKEEQALARATRRQKKRKPSMKVSGKSVFKIQRIIKKKAKA